MNQYKHLAQSQRYHIYQCLKLKMTQSAIAKSIGAHKSTISGEIKRNTGKRNYRYKQAQALTCGRQSIPKYQKWNGDIQEIINNKLRLQWNPEQISRHLKVSKNINLPHERIYQYILQDKKRGGDLWTHLKSKLLLAKPVKKRTAALVSEVIQLLKPYIKHTYTLTPDNGKEFAYHQHIVKQLNTNVYFANPYSSWERGLNEHTNGLLRQYLPKKMAFDSLKQEQVNKAVALLNDRPRKNLNYQTSKIAFESGIIQQQKVALGI